MACLLAAVETTVELVATDQEALVLNILGRQKDRSNAHSSAPITNFYYIVFNMTIIISLIYLLFVSVLKCVISNRMSHCDHHLPSIKTMFLYRALFLTYNSAVFVADRIWNVAIISLCVRVAWKATIKVIIARISKVPFFVHAPQVLRITLSPLYCLWWHKIHNTYSLKTYHTTQFATLVSAAGTFLVAALLASEDKLIWNRNKK